MVRQFTLALHITGAAGSFLPSNKSFQRIQHDRTRRKMSLRKSVDRASNASEGILGVRRTNNAHLLAPESAVTEPADLPAASPLGRSGIRSLFYAPEKPAFASATTGQSLNASGYSKKDRATARLRIFIADDQPLVCDALAAAMAAVDELQVVAAISKLDVVVPLVKKTNPHLLLLDTSWAQDGAWRIARELFRDIPSIQIVMMQDDHERSKGVAARHHGVAGFISKRHRLGRVVKYLLRWHGKSLGPRKKSTSATAHLPDADHGFTSANLVARLSAREFEVLINVAKGMTASECAHHMNLAVSTVENHKWRLMRKLGVHKTTDLVRIAVSAGLVHE